jgi:hypothetical protein
MVRYPNKLFKYDKNYLLKEAQLQTREKLLKAMIDHVKNYYLTYHNPLGLVDSAVLKIKNSTNYNFQNFEFFYNFLCGIYRFKNPDNQLPICFDGRSPLEFYQEEWEISFQQLIKEFVKHENFLKAVLEATVFYCNSHRELMAHNRMKNFLINHFAIKLYKYKGLVAMKVA